jgi:hypothetical protein
MDIEIGARILAFNNTGVSCLPGACRAIIVVGYE